MIRKDQRDVWLMNAPFSDYLSSKVRPVIILSNNRYNKSMPDFIAVHITTKKNDQYSIDISNSDFVNGSLFDESVVRFDTINRYEEKLLIKKIGKIKPELFKKINENIVRLIGLPSESQSSSS